MKSGTIEEKFKSHLESIKDQIKAGIDSGKYTLEEIEKTVVNRARCVAKTTDAYVHENPWAALGTAAALGLTIGFLMRRR